MAVNVGAAVTALVSDTLTVTRTGAVNAATGGYTTTPSTSSFSITASVQPIIGADLQWPREGGRQTARIALYVQSAQTALRIPVNGGGNQADIVSWGGGSWKLVEVEYWSAYGY